MKVTKLLTKQTFDLNDLVRAMDGEVRRLFALPPVWPERFAASNAVNLRWSRLFQPVAFSGLDEGEAAHFLCGLRRLNKIAEVQP